MNKAQLIDEVAGRTGMSKKAVGDVVDGRYPGIGRVRW